MTLQSPSRSHAQPFFATAWMLGAIFSFTAMAVSAREISFELDTFQLMFFRSLIGLFVILLVAKLSPRGLAQFRTRRLRLHLGRNLIHFVGQFGWFYAIALIPLAQVFAIEFTIPLWVALLAPFVLHERMTAARWAAVLIGFVGILIIVRPGASPVSSGHLGAVIAALAFAGTIMITKRLAPTESSLAILFYMALIQAPLGLIPSLDHLQMPTLITWGWLVVVTLCGLSAHFCMAQALRLADATLIMPIDFLRLPLVATVGMMLYSEALDPWVFVGGALILGGNYASLRAVRRAARNAA